MRQFVLITMALVIGTGCVSTSVTSEGTTTRLFGKATAKIECVETTTQELEGTTSTETTCTTEAKGHGISENALGAVSKLFETVLALPGAVVRTAGGALP